MTLRTVTIDAKGRLGREREIDTRTCECCQTAAIPVEGGMLVAYRDRSDEEVRDCAIVRVTADDISDARPVHADGWNQEGCPVNGPSLAIAGERVAAVWYTEAKRPQVRACFSEDGGRSFGKPIVIDDGNPVGRVDIVPHPEAGWLVCWLERGDGTGEVRVRAVTPDGDVRPSLLVARTSESRAAGFPRIERLGARVIVAWTEVENAPAGTTAPARVRTAELVYPVEDEESDSP